MKQMNRKLFEAQKAEIFPDLQSFIDEDESAKKAFMDLYDPDGEYVDDANGQFGDDEEIITALLNHMLRDKEGFFGVDYDELNDNFKISITYDGVVGEMFVEGLSEITKLSIKDLKTILKEVI